MFPFVVAYQNHIYNRTICSWDDIDAWYGFHKLEQRETCLIESFYSLRKFAVRVYAGGLNRSLLAIPRWMALSDYLLILESLWILETFEAFIAFQRNSKLLVLKFFLEHSISATVSPKRKYTLLLSRVHKTEGGADEWWVWRTPYFSFSPLRFWVLGFAPSVYFLLVETVKHYTTFLKAGFISDRSICFQLPKFKCLSYASQMLNSLDCLSHLNLFGQEYFISCDYFGTLFWNAPQTCGLRYAKRSLMSRPSFFWYDNDSGH